MTDPTSSKDIDQFMRSLDRASLDPQFLDVFYRGFMGQSPEIRELFRDSDMDALKHKLRATLHLTTMVAEAAPGTAMYLEHLGRVHLRLNIGIELYEVWLDSLLAAVEQCDPEFDKEIAGLWRRYLSKTIEILKSQYPRVASNG